MNWAMNSSDLQAMQGKIVLITGANSGIGKETARGLAKMGAAVVMACRNLTRAVPVCEAIKQESGNAQIEVMQLDLTLLRSVREFSSQFQRKYQQLNVLINNAGVMCVGGGETEDGFNRVMATNYLGPFLLTNLLLPLLKQTKEARIINVSSITHLWGRIDLNDINFKRKYRFGGPYASSKLALIFFTQELSEQLQQTDITANALHPGIVATNIYRIGPEGSWYQAGFRRMLSLVMISPQDGAQTSIYLASSDDVRGVTGKYFYKLNPSFVSPKCRNIQLQKGLWQLSEKLTGLTEASLG
jgi:NAD(P)-dependent dehydrogenase (short-subunit alcohol dehydrogenase family)